MRFAEFAESLQQDLAPEGISGHLLALWYDGKGNWHQAHGLVQDIADDNAAWIHAYLHRKEGDNGNADYWYARAGKKRPSLSLDEEWKVIAAALCGF